jgi:hypothetical protein
LGGQDELTRLVLSPRSLARGPEELVTLALDPVAFSILGLPVRWYGLFAAASIRVAYLIARSLARRRGVADSLVADGTLQPVEHPRLLEVRR